MYMGPPNPGYPPYQAPPPRAPGGFIWLGIILSIFLTIGLPIMLSWAAAMIGWSTGGSFALCFLLAIVVAVILTCIRDTRRTGIGMWIGIAAIPIIGFGTCIVLIASLAS